MNNLTRECYLLIIIAIVSLSHVSGQVGINTLTPNGILDVTSTTMGIVPPKAALTASNVMAPVVNPQGGSLAIGTTVYNTATTSNGLNDVVPGLYTWDGTEWQGQFLKRQYKKYESSVGTLRSTAGTALTVPLNGLSTQTFTANYTGEYKILIRVDFAGGNAKPPREGSAANRSDGDLNIASALGAYTFTFNGSNYTIPVYAYSTAYNAVTPATNYFAIWEEFTITEYVTLTANQTVNLSLSFLQDTSTREEFEGNATSGGRGYVAYDIPCRIEISYNGE
ncbi:MAG: hypothetical protein R2793_04290 [Flavobacteriaceae bacterium]